MKIIVVALLKPSQINYKIIPLTRSDYVDEVIIIRKEKGPEIDKVSYIILPKICKLTPFYLLLTPFLIAYFAIKIKADLILSYHFVPHGFFSYLASVMSRKPFIYSQIDLDIQNLTENRFFKPIILYIIKKAKVINVPGSKSMNFWVSSGIDKTKINLLHSTIDTQNCYYPIKTAKVYDFIYVGTLEKRKQLNMIIEALSLLKKDTGITNLKFCIIGNGEEEKNLKALSQKLNLEDNIVFPSQQYNIIEWLNKSKIFVMASRNEGIPCAMMEAMACELIPIVPDVADIADVVKNNTTGILLEETSPNSLYAAMRYAYQRYNDLHEMRKKSREIIQENHSYQSAIKKWNMILKEINLT